MSKKTRVVGATLAAVAFSLFFVGGAFAAPPTYDITLDKWAADADGDPVTSLSGAGTVDYWFAVENVGTGDFQGVAVTDSDCSPVFDHSSDASDDDQGGGDKLDSGDTWWFVCEDVAVTPPHTNNATAAACHDSSVESCNQDAHYDEATDSYTISKGTSTFTVDDVARNAGPLMLAFILLAIGGLGFLGSTNRLPKLPKIS